MFRLARHQARCKPKGECELKKRCLRNSEKVYHDSIIIDETENMVNMDCMLFIDNGVEDECS